MNIQHLHIRPSLRFVYEKVRSLVREVVAPPMCAYCKRFMHDYHVLCDACAAHIQPVVSSRLEVTAHKELWVFAVSAYCNPLKALVLAKGHSDIVAARQLGQLVWEMTYIKNVPFDYIVAVPTHWSRYAKRGYNQSLEMARVIAHLSGRPLIQPLKRVKRTRFQSSLDKTMRAHNVHEAFEYTRGDWSFLRGARILMVDDLLTTGATMKEVARALYLVHPGGLVGVVACRVV